MLKSDFHMHSDYDMEKKALPYKFPELIDHCSKSKYEVLSITNHDKFMFNKRMQDHAKKRGILLIPGCERTIEGKHVLLINTTADMVDKIRTFSDLEKYKDEDLVVIAPHPYYPHKNALNEKLEKNIKLFDAIEYSHFYFKYINYNEKAVKIAKKYDLPLVGTSDAHSLLQLNKTFTLLDCEKKLDSILDAIRKNKFKIKSRPISAISALKIAFEMGFTNRFRKIL